MQQRIIFVCLALTLVLAGCNQPHSSGEKPKQELRLNLHTEPPALDPRKATDTVSIAVINMCFEGLYKLGAQNEAIPALAERVELSEDQLTYTFYLRKALWSDGKPITAHDFETTWKSILEPHFNCHFASDYYVIKNAKEAKEKSCTLDEVGIKALSDQILEVKVAHPTPYFLSLIASHAFIATPAHIVTKHPHWAKEASPLFVGSGPFMLKKWRHYDEIIVEKNPYYWDKDAVILDRISLPMIPDESTELNMFESGALDWAGKPFSALPTDSMPALERTGRVDTYPIAATYYYIFNTKVFPFNNVHIRRAFALAINRQEIIDNVLQAHQLPASGLIPPSMWQSHYFTDGDIKMAQKEFAIGLKELGIKSENFPSITLSYNTSEGHHKVAQAIQGQWLKALGISVKLENKEWKVFLNDVNKCQFQVARMGGVASFHDPVTFLDLYKYASNSNNHTQWFNPRYAELMERADRTPDPMQRIPLLKEAEKILIEEMPLAPIYFYTSSYLKKPYVKGVLLTEIGDADFKTAYIENPR